MGQHASYGRSQTYVFVWVFTPLVSAAAGGFVLATKDPGAMIGVAILVVVNVLLMLLLGRLRIEVTQRQLRWRYGFVGWPAWSVELSDIERVEPTRTQAAQGSGIRPHGRRQLYNAVLAGPALRLLMRDGREIVLGTPEPQRLLAFIQARRSER